MTLFSRKTTAKEKNSKFVGVFLPPHINEYLTLYSLAAEIPKTTIITNLLDNWIEETDELLNELELLTKLAEKAIHNFENLKKTKSIGFKRFLLMMDSELKKKGIKTDFINKLKIIIKKKYGYE